MIKFINEKTGKVLISYNGSTDNDEITATRELLEFENNCKVIVEFDFLAVIGK